LSGPEQDDTVLWLNEHCRLCNESPEVKDRSEVNEECTTVPATSGYGLMFSGCPIRLVLSTFRRVRKIAKSDY
jgi:hypothetical protein